VNSSSDDNSYVSRFNRENVKNISGLFENSSTAQKRQELLLHSAGACSADLASHVTQRFHNLTLKAPCCARSYCWSLGPRSVPPPRHRSSPRAQGLSQERPGANAQSRPLNRDAGGSEKMEVWLTGNFEYPLHPHSPEGNVVFHLETGLIQNEIAQVFLLFGSYQLP